MNARKFFMSLLSVDRFILLTSIKYELVNSILGDLLGAQSSYESFEVTEGESGFIERGLLIAFDSLVVHMFFAHLGPVDIDDPFKDVRVQLCIFYLAIMFGECFGWQGLCLAFTTFIPPDIPALRVFPFIDPDLFHSIHSIVILEV